MHQNPVHDIPHYLRVYQTYLGPRMYLVFAFTLAAALAEGFGLLMLLPLLQGLDSGADRTAEPAGGIATVLQDMLSVFGWANSSVAIVLFITVAFVLKGAFLFGAHAFIALMRARLLRELKARMFDDYSRMSFRYYAERDTGHFINVINTQISQMLTSFISLMSLGSQVVTSVIYIALAFVVAWRFGVMALFIGLVLLYLFRSISAYVRKLSRRSASENGHLSKLLIQFLHAYKYLTATGQAGHVRSAVMTSIRRLTDYEMRRGIAAAFSSSVREPITVIFVMLIVLMQMAVLEDPLAPILVSILLFYRGLNTVLILQSTWLGVLNQIGSLEMVRDEFKSQWRHREPDSVRALTALGHGISLRNVHFCYDPALGDVLDNVSLDIPVRTSVALVGESGAGKSTIVDLLTLMLKPSRGQILIDNVPSDQVELISWRRQIGYVCQETVIFDDTIANNICMWEGDAFSDPVLLERVCTAARQAYIADFIEGLPDRYQTLVGDRGVRLSGGQRQRLFIARELFREPNLLILDEATSALDTESERYIQKSIDSLKGRITVIMIAHRLSTIRNVDYIYLFDRGRLVEHGPYEDLRDTRDSRFGRLVALQSL